MAAEESKQETLDLSTKVTLDSVKIEGGGFVICSGDKCSMPTKGTRVFLRADFNVPLGENGEITDTTRISSTVPTIKKLLSMSPSRLVVTSHLGRPKGQKKEKLSLAPVVAELEKQVGVKCVLVPDWFRDDLEEVLSKQEKGAICVLENARFYIEEEGKGEINGEKAKADAEKVAQMRKILTSIADMFVCDAFGTCHRGHSSMVGCDAPIKCAGLLVKKELEYFDKALSKPERPYLAILGGAKVSDKIQVIESLLDRVDQMVIAGGMCFTFLKVAGMPIGKSLFDEEGAKIVQQILDKAKEKKVEIILPSDFVCGDDFKNDAKIENTDKEKGVPEGYMGLDVGPKSTQLICDAVMKAKTVVFNGPPGVFEMENFSAGTKALVDALAKATANGTTTIVGGGDSASACNKFGAGDKVSHVSTGGGASLELLEGKILPGVAFLSDISKFFSA